MNNTVPLISCMLDSHCYFHSDQRAGINEQQHQQKSYVKADMRYLIGARLIGTTLQRALKLLRRRSYIVALEMQKCSLLKLVSAMAMVTATAKGNQPADR